MKFKTLYYNNNMAGSQAVIVQFWHCIRVRYEKVPIWAGMEAMVGEYIDYTQMGTDRL